MSSDTGYYLAYSVFFLIFSLLQLPNTAVPTDQDWKRLLLCAMSCFYFASGNALNRKKKRHMINLLNHRGSLILTAEVQSVQKSRTVPHWPPPTHSLTSFLRLSDHEDLGSALPSPFYHPLQSS